MKTTLIFIIFSVISFNAISQSVYSSGKNLKTLDGSSISFDEIFNNSDGTILVFWEMNNTRCSQNLENLSQAWMEEVKGLNVDLIAICIDRQGNWSAVKPFVSGQGWEFETYIDANSELIRSLGISNMPQTVLLDRERNVRCSYAGYCTGDEFQICEKIVNCLEKTGDLANL